jgi:mannose-6-phosphate isomerase-like protein (cupin superfamily)
MSEQDWHVSSLDIRDGLTAAGEPFFTAMVHGTMRFLLFSPKVTDVQRPHIQDELYIISRGTSRFVRNDEWVTVSAGDALFVPATMKHRFEEMSDDFETWVVFWGEKGGKVSI